MDNDDNQKKKFDWSMIIKIIMVVVGVVILFFLLKQLVMPNETVEFGLDTPSEVNLTAIPEIEGYRS